MAEWFGDGPPDSVSWVQYVQQQNRADKAEADRDGFKRYHEQIREEYELTLEELAEAQAEIKRLADALVEALRWMPGRSLAG